MPKGQEWWAARKKHSSRDGVGETSLHAVAAMTTTYLDLVRTAEELTGNPPAEFQTQTVAGAADMLKLPW